MIGLKESVIAFGFFALGLTTAHISKQAQAHGNALTRLDIQQAMREALRNQPQQRLSATDIQRAVKQGLSGCRFKGQHIAEERREPTDSTDFRGQLAC